MRKSSVLYIMICGIVLVLNIVLIAIGLSKHNTYLFLSGLFGIVSYLVMIVVGLKYVGTADEAAEFFRTIFS